MSPKPESTKQNAPKPNDKQYINTETNTELKSNTKQENTSEIRSNIPEFQLIEKLNYVRLEPSNINYSLKDGIQARIKDPLWMIGRQWQLGEFNSYNGGKPVRVETNFETSLLNKINLGKNQTEWKEFDINKPLEYLVEEDINKAWDKEKLEYNFSIKSEKVELNSPSYDGNNLDWYHFNISKSAFGGNLNKKFQINTKPTPLRYMGMPLQRWWSFEDARVNLGDIRRPYLNFLTSIIVELAICDANDWYIIPLEHQLGNIRKINSLKVIDSFGVITDINPVIKGIGKETWQMFTLSTNDSNKKEDGALMYIPNNLHHSLESDSLEKVSLFRDEMANLVWAIEHSYQNKDNEIMNRNDELKLTCTICGIEEEDEERLKEHIESNHGLESRNYWSLKEGKIITHKDYTKKTELEKKEEEIIGPILLYRDKSYVPRNWIPYIPLLIENGQIRLRRGRTIEGEKQYKGNIIEESVKISEECIPRTGLMLIRNIQLARGINGEIYLWTGKYKIIDERKKSIGLRFDILVQ